MNDKLLETYSRWHSEWPVVDKLARAASLRIERVRLNQMAWQIVFYFQHKGWISSEERTQALRLLEKMDEVEGERVMAWDELRNEFVDILRKDKLYKI